MSNKEKELIQKVGKMPEDLQDAFLNMASGALMALDSMKKDREARAEDGREEESA